jgi:transposase
MRSMLDGRSNLLISITIEESRSSIPFRLESVDPKAVENMKVLGIDKGIKNIPVTSDNQFYGSKSIFGVPAK